MHIVTKILIVACALLSLVLSALSIAYTANAAALKSQYKNEYALRIAAEETARAGTQSGSEERATMSTRIQSLEGEVAARTSEIAKLQEERTSLRSELEKARSEAASIRAQIGQFTATAETQATMIKSFRDEVTSLREGLLAAQKREIELVDRVNELESVREVLQQNARALKEQLEETKLALQSAQQGGATSARPGDNLARELPGTIIQARVDRVFTSPSGEPMVEITEGSNRGIKQNSLMHVVRNGEQYIGQLTIMAVEPTRSVGRVNTLGKPFTPQQNDVVLSRIAN